MKLFSLFITLQVLNDTKYWSWLNDVFVPGVFAGKWYNGQEENQTMYIGDKRAVLVGMARARQLRVKPSKFLLLRVQTCFACIFLLCLDPVMEFLAKQHNKGLKLDHFLTIFL